MGSDRGYVADRPQNRSFFLERNVCASRSDPERIDGSPLLMRAVRGTAAIFAHHSGKVAKFWTGE
jgi:hypothetical protein